MPVVSTPQEYHEDDLYIDLRASLGTPLYLKCEGFNFAGSIKLKAAMEMITAAEREGLITDESILIESSSGNLGVALSMLAADKGFEFLCVTDPRASMASRRLIEALGSKVHVVEEVAPDSSYLAARLAYVYALCEADKRYVWLNQYANRANWGAHYRRTAPAIAERFPDLDVLFVGSGTTGTLMGCARYFREHSAGVHIVAVDAVGSVTFGGAPARRLIPGLGTSVPPAIFERSYVDEVVYVPEHETVRMCRRLASRGFLLGGSTGTVVSGATRWLAEHDLNPGLTAVAIAPDLGERYLDTVYLDGWLEREALDEQRGRECLTFTGIPRMS